MTLYEKWLTMAYDSEGRPLKSFWDGYAPKEERIYRDILSKKQNSITATVGELSKEYDLPPEYICGFIDGINEAMTERLGIEKIKEFDENTSVSINFKFEDLYKKMVEFKASHLYNLPEWENIFDQETRNELYKEQKHSKTIIKPDKVGRNDPCPCGSGKKYKKCCGA